MNIEFRPYLVALIALFMLAGPWLKSTEAKPSSEKTICGCHQESCQGCCCSQPKSPQETKPVNETNGCNCEFSSFPVIPAVSFEFNLHLPDDRNIKTEAESTRVAKPGDILSLYDHSADKSPPLAVSRPAYILFSTLLI